MTSLALQLPEMNMAYAESLFNRYTGGSFCHPRYRPSVTWTLRKCIMRQIHKDKISVEIFEDPEVHAWLLQLNACMETLAPEMMSQTQRHWIPIYTADDHTLHLKDKDNRLSSNLYAVGADVDVTFKISCAWFNDTLIGVSMKLVSIDSSADGL